MAEGVAKHAIKKLEDNLTCAICRDAFKEPKFLQCFHVFCKDCLQKLPIHDQQGQLSLCCPNCRQSTILPPTATDVSSLQSAFHVHNLLEIKDALEKLKEPKKVMCDKCKTPRLATSYCRDCGHFICEICSIVHSDWDTFAKHEVIVIEQLESKVKQLDSLKKVTLYCCLHQGKELELYCETCEELICYNCTVSKHSRPEHKYDLVADTFDRHKNDITTSLEPVDEQLGVYDNGLELIGVQLLELDNQEAAVEASIRQDAEQLHKVIEERKAELIGRLHQLTKSKKKSLAAQNEELETGKTKLASCQSFVRDCLRTGSQGEVMRVKGTVTKQVRELTSNFKPDIITPCEPINIKYVSSPEIALTCRKFGKVYLKQTSPENCYATGIGVEIAEPGKRAAALLHTVDHDGKACSTPVETVTCELVSEITGETTLCLVRAIEETEASQYEISYQPTRRGKYKLHIKVEGESIKESPFRITVKLPLEKLSSPIKTISEVKNPWGVAVNKKQEIIIAEAGRQCVSIYKPTGEKLRSFGSKGSGHGQFDSPRGVAVDDDDNILVVDLNNCRIQKFTSEGNFITAVGQKGNQPLTFNVPIGIAIHPFNKKVYIADQYNHRIQILNSDMTFSSSFGSQGSGNGEFQNPWDVAFDSKGNVYVADSDNHRIHVFTEEGKFLTKFGKYGEGKGELNWPSSISIDNENVVYVTDDNNHRISVFTCEGIFLTSFGTKGNQPGQFNCPRGIAIDKNGVIYVCDCGNDFLHLL